MLDLQDLGLGNSPCMRIWLVSKYLIIKPGGHEPTHSPRHIVLCARMKHHGGLGALADRDLIWKCAVGIPANTCNQEQKTTRN